MASSVEGVIGAAATVAREIDTSPGRQDRIFRWIAAGAAAATLSLIVLVTIFLTREAWPAVDVAGWSFLTGRAWSPSAGAGSFGIAAMMYGTVVTAVVAMAITVPVSVATALFINEYAPVRARSGLTSLVDLMAAIPSLVYGMWGLFFLEPRLFGIENWLTTHLDFVPIFRVEGPLGASLFNAGLIVSLMTLPITTSIVREVLAQVPRAEVEAALALGGTRWATIRSVILPFGRPGIVGGSMLGLGRALGETIAVTLILNFQHVITPRILESGGVTVASVIAVSFGEAQELGISALMAAGLALFLVTLVVNLFAAVVVERSRPEGRA